MVLDRSEPGRMIPANNVKLFSYQIRNSNSNQNSKEMNIDSLKKNQSNNDANTTSAPQLILASASPRRIEMFRKNGFDPLVMPSDQEERIPSFLTPAETVMFLALQKGLSVYRKLSDNVIRKDNDSNIDNNSDKTAGLSATDLFSALIVSADTIVVDYAAASNSSRGLTNSRILGKPKNENEAYEMLSSLSGRSHYVLTGVCLIAAGRAKCFYDSSEVFFKYIPDDELRAYVKTAEPYDKAGGYAIQETFGKYTDHIIGDLDNIIGFPFQRFLKETDLL